MRQLATLPDERAAQTLADYLLTLQIETQLNQEPEGWAVWVRNEDQLAKARAELTEFTHNPADPRFSSATRSAQALRVQQAKEDAQYQRNLINLRDRWVDRAGRPVLTYLLIFLSLGVGLATKLGENATRDPLLLALYITSDRQAGLDPILHGQVWRLVTPIVIHFGPFHLLFNMIWLYQLGGAIEMRRGVWRYGLMVLFIAIVSNVAQYYLGDLRLNVGWRLAGPHSFYFGGMSGVVYGLIGYIWMKGRFQPHLGLILPQQTLMWAFLWFFLCMAGAVGDIANEAHAAGLWLGMVIGVAPYMWRKLRGR